MPMRTMRLLGVTRNRGDPPRYIHSLSDHVEMCWIDTRGAPTEMIENITNRNLPPHTLVDKPMG